MDFFIPRIVHGLAAIVPGSGEQSETCTAWRGLSSQGADELFAWTSTFDFVLKHRDERSPYSVSLFSIVAEMVERFEQRPPCGLNWFSSAPNIYARVERFLSMSMDKPSLEVQELEVPVVGQEYTLALRVVTSSEDLTGGFAKETIFTTSVNWLFFDPSCQIFSGVVPVAPPSNIIVKAKVIEYLDERVRLEHVIRARMNLRAHAGISAENHSAATFTDPTTHRQVFKENDLPRKHVSFVDEHETNSLHSSPDHLRSFFNDLSALTCGQTTEKSPRELTLARQSQFIASYLNDGYIVIPDGFPEANAEVEVSEKSGTINTSQSISASVADSSGPRRLPIDNSPVQLYHHLQQPCDEQGESLYERVGPVPKKGNYSFTCQTKGLRVGQDRARNSSSGGHDRTGRIREKALSFYDSDMNLDFEVALGLSQPGDELGTYLPQPGPAVPLVFENRLDSLPKCSNMDRPTRACESIVDSEADSKYDDCDLLEHRAFGSIPPTIYPVKHEPLGSLGDLWNDLCQWNWKGWEQEIGIRQCHSKSSKPGVSIEISEDEVPSMYDEGRPGARVAELERSEKIWGKDGKNERAVLGGQSHQKSISQTMSCTPRSRCNRNSSEASWSDADEATVLGKATNSVDRPSTLYDTVRSQFRKDHHIRQMFSSRHSKLFSARAALSGMFSSNPDHPELNYNSSSSGQEDLLVFPSETRTENATKSGFQINGHPPNPASLNSADEGEPYIGSIAAAVKRSLAAEVEDQDGREKAEIRKGILHHQVMELSRKERRRDFGSSNYDDIFWSSDGANGDDKLDVGMD